VRVFWGGGLGGWGQKLYIISFRILFICISS